MDLSNLNEIVSFEEARMKDDLMSIFKELVATDEIWELAGGQTNLAEENEGLTSYPTIMIKVDDGGVIGRTRAIAEPELYSTFIITIEIYTTGHRTKPEINKLIQSSMIADLVKKALLKTWGLNCQQNLIVDYTWDSKAIRRVMRFSNTINNKHRVIVK